MFLCAGKSVLRPLDFVYRMLLYPCFCMMDATSASDGSKRVDVLPFDGQDIDTWAWEFQHFMGARNYHAYTLMYDSNITLNPL